MRLPIFHKSDTKSTLVASDDSQLMDARRRAGTLMGGETAGGQGEVRIWQSKHRNVSPANGQLPEDFQKLVRSATGSLPLFVQSLGIALFATLLFAAIGHFAVPFQHGWWKAILGGAIVIGVGAVAVKPPDIDKLISQTFPSFVSTDDAGIAFVLGVNSVSLLWEEVLGMRRMGYSGLTLYTRSSGVRYISVAAFSRRDVKSLEALIRLRANLSDRIRRDPDWRMELARKLASYRPERGGWSRKPRAMLYGWIFRLCLPGGPLYARPGETIESLAAAGTAKPLPKPEDDASSEPSGDSGPDATGLR